MVTGCDVLLLSFWAFKWAIFLDPNNTSQNCPVQFWKLIVLPIAIFAAKTIPSTAGCGLFFFSHWACRQLLIQLLILSSSFEPTIIRSDQTNQCQFLCLQRIISLLKIFFKFAPLVQENFF